LDRPGKVPVLERRPHPGVLVRWDGSTEDERLGGAADPRAQTADDDVVRPPLGEADRPDLAVPRLSEPERLSDSVLEASIAGVFARRSHRLCVEVTRDVLRRILILRT